MSPYRLLHRRKLDKLPKFLLFFSFSFSSFSFLTMSKCFWISSNDWAPGRIFAAVSPWSTAFKTELRTLSIPENPSSSSSRLAMNLLSSAHGRDSDVIALLGTGFGSVTDIRFSRAFRSAWTFSISRRIRSDSERTSENKKKLSVRCWFDRSDPKN